MNVSGPVRVPVQDLGKSGSGTDPEAQADRASGGDVCLEWGDGFVGRALNRRFVLVLVLVLVALAACTRPPAMPEGGTSQRGGEPAVVVAAEENLVPAGGDGAPRLSLAFQRADGSLQPIAEKALAFAQFRDGVALVALDRQLVLVSPDGSRSVLARRSGAPPLRGPGGELWYVARYGQGSEVHALEVSGRDRIVASGLSSAGLLAPQKDGRLLMVAADGRGVAGLWYADARGARCLTNCELVAGAPWREPFVPLPIGARAIEMSGGVVEWDASDGTRRSVAMSGLGTGSSSSAIGEAQ